MQPILFTIGNINIYSFSTLLFSGIVISLLIFYWLSKKEDLDSEIIYKNLFLLFVVSIISGRLLHIILLWNKYTDSFLSLFYIWDGGISMWGVLISLYIMTQYIFIKTKQHTAKWLDILSISVLPALVFGFLGKHMKGEGFGSSTDFFLGVINENINSPFFAVQIHPTSLYLAILTLIIFIISCTIFLMSFRPFFGFIFYLNCILFLIAHVSIVTMRQDVPYIFYGYNANKTISILILTIVLLYFLITIWRLYEKKIKAKFTSIFSDSNSRRS